MEFTRPFAKDIDVCSEDVSKSRTFAMEFLIVLMLKTKNRNFVRNGISGAI